MMELDPEKQRPGYYSDKFAEFEPTYSNLESLREEMVNDKIDEDKVLQLLKEYATVRTLENTEYLLVIYKLVK